MQENIINLLLKVDKLKIWQEKIKKLKLEIQALALALTHPRTPLYCKIIILIVVGYALSPIDLIPDFIPIFGLIDDLLLLPLGILLAIKLTPKAVITECRIKAAEKPVTLKNNWIAALIIVFIWIGLLSWLIIVVSSATTHHS